MSTISVQDIQRDPLTFFQRIEAGEAFVVVRGERPLAEVLDAITSAETRLTELRDSHALPDQPDWAWVDDWLHRSYLAFWAER